MRIVMRWVLVLLSALACLVAIAWSVGALYFDFPIASLRVPLALVFAVAMVTAWIFVSGRGRATAVVAVGFAAVLSWWLTIRPSNTADWLSDVAQTAFAEVDGDNVVIHNFRNCDYRTETDYDARWETKAVHLSNLRGVDFYTDYWGSKLICHTFLSFDFGPDGFVCISIETRKKKGQTYSAIRGFYRQFTLCYIIGDERDIVRVRTNYRHEDLYVYRLLPATPAKGRALFLDYLRSANMLHEKPKWYNAITSNCTTNIRLHVKDIGSAYPWDWQILVNGYIAERVYQLHAIDTSLPFAELKRRSYIVPRALAADRDPDFSLRIREGVPAMPQAVLELKPSG